MDTREKGSDDICGSKNKRRRQKRMIKKLKKQNQNQSSAKTVGVNEHVEPDKEVIDLDDERRIRMLREKPWRRQIEGVDDQSPLGGLVQKFSWLMRNNIDVADYEAYLNAMEADDKIRWK